MGNWLSKLDRNSRFLGERNSRYFNRRVYVLSRHLAHGLKNVAVADPTALELPLHHQVSGMGGVEPGGSPAGRRSNTTPVSAVPPWGGSNYATGTV